MMCNQLSNLSLRENMSLDDALNETYKAIRSLNPSRPDNLEDYFHDAIARAMHRGKSLDTHQVYLFRTVERRIAYGQEEHRGVTHLPLYEEVVPSVQNEHIDLVLDIQRAMSRLTDLQYEYIYMFFYEGHTLEEIAMLRDTTYQSVERCIQRGLAQMKQALT